MKRIALFASGTGTNAANIIGYFSGHPFIEVACIVTNKQSAGVMQVAAQKNIPAYYFSKKQLNETDDVLTLLQQQHIDLIVLAGFLLLIPVNLLQAFPNKIINIHPALLPQHGGAGMYGMKVHEAVIAAHERYSGITIHYANENFDEGEIIARHRVVLSPGETPQSLAAKIHELEYKWYPQVIEQLLVS